MWNWIDISNPTIITQILQSVLYILGEHLINIYTDGLKNGLDTGCVLCKH